MRHLHLITTISFAFALSFLIAAGSAFASEEIAQQEGLVCTVCHDKPGSKLLTDRGKYFELMGGMDGFDEIEAGFQRCTYCHRRRPGSEKLTKVGEQFNNLVGDMEGLLEMLRSSHPVLPAADSEHDGGSDNSSDSGSRSGGADSESSSAGDLQPISCH